MKNPKFGRVSWLFSEIFKKWFFAILDMMLWMDLGFYFFKSNFFFILQLLAPVSLWRDSYKWVKFQFEIFFRKGQKCAINKKSTIFVRLSSKFQGWSRKFSWPTHKIWAQSDKNCGFFVNSQIFAKNRLLTKNQQF